MEIRELAEGDLESLMELYVQLAEQNRDYSLDTSREIWRKIALDESITYFGAVENGKVISTCYLAIIPNLTSNGRPVGFIENVVTDEAFRGKGIGTKVMEAAIQRCRRENCYKAILLSGTQRKEAHLFYKKLGFSDTTKKAFDLRLNG